MLSLSEEKKSLELKEEFYKEQLHQDFASLDGDYEKLGLWTLFGAAVGLVGYLIVRKLISQKKVGKKRNYYIYDQQDSELVMNSSLETSPLVSKIKQYIALFILSIVKEKLNSLLKDSQLNK